MKKEKLISPILSVHCAFDFIVTVSFLGSLLGLDEESHWFVCKSGFKSRCESLVYESWEDLGFVMYRHTNNDRGSSVHEAWKRNMFRSTLIRGIVQ